MNDLHASTSFPLESPDPAQTILDARSDSRVAVDFSIQIFSKDFQGTLLASARDLSVGGMCVATTSIFSFNSIRRVRLLLGTGDLDLDVEGRWQSESKSNDFILTGVRFVEPNRNEVSQLWSVVRDANKELGLFLFDRSDLSNLSADDATNLADSSRYRLVAARRRIYRQDECHAGDDSIFLVLRGEVSLTVRLGNRREVTLERLTPGGVFGGLPAVADFPHQESAVADTQSTLLEISRASFNYMRLAKPLLAHRLAQIITRSQVRRSGKLLELTSSLPR